MLGILTNVNNIDMIDSEFTDEQNAILNSEKTLLKKLGNPKEKTDLQQNFISYHPTSSRLFFL
jgi:hypothetical protein